MELNYTIPTLLIGNEETFPAQKMELNYTIPTLLMGNEETSHFWRTFNLIFATFSLRASMLVLLAICSVVIYHVCLLVTKDLWKAHREVAASLGLDQCQCRVYRDRIDRCFHRCCARQRNATDNI